MGTGWKARLHKKEDQVRMVLVPPRVSRNLGGKGADGKEEEERGRVI